MVEPEIRPSVRSAGRGRTLIRETHFYTEVDLSEQAISFQPVTLLMGVRFVQVIY